MDGPKTLTEAIKFFADPDNCLAYLSERRWPKGVVCPTCGRKDVRFISTRRMWECKNKHPRKQFSIKIGTIFEDSPIGLDKWLAAVWMITNCKNGVSSWEIHRALGVTQKTAWFMLHRIRLAMQAGPFVRSMSGHVEADETFIGGKARNMHKHKKDAKLGYRQGAEGKTIVAAVLERHGEVRAQVVTHRRKWQLQNLIKDNVEEGSNVYTDALRSYAGLDKKFVHQVIDHAETYVKGNVHTNGLENFWSLLKRGINGTYVSVEPFHLFRYIDEQSYRYNNRREMDDADRFSKVLTQIAGRRLTYKELTGKVGETPF
jgi:transposase-like protein